MQVLWITLLGTFVSCSSVTAENHWNQFRGPHGDGKSLAAICDLRWK